MIYLRTQLASNKSKELNIGLAIFITSVIIVESGINLCDTLTCGKSTIKLLPLLMITSLVAAYGYPGVETWNPLSRKGGSQAWLVFHHPKSSP